MVQRSEGRPSARAFDGVTRVATVLGEQHLATRDELRVGMEGGLDYFDRHLMAFAWMVVTGRGKRSSETRSATLPLPPEVQRLVAGGLELGEANDRVFSTLNSKQGGGAYGLLTNGLMTRESIYTQTLILALIPFVNQLWD